MQGYAITAQYYDALASAAHVETDRRIATALAEIAPVVEPILDIGAGTGLTTALIAATCREVDILAVEPDPAMRPALMTRVWSDPDMRERVTILPFGILEAPLPDRIAGAVLSASLVHLGPAERAQLWPMLAKRLVPGGRVIVEVQCPFAEDMGETEMAAVQVGRMRYRAAARAERIGHDRQRWRMTYRASFDGREIACDVATYDCWTISGNQLLEETRAAGFAGALSDNLVILRHVHD